jgi:hypothetical protein
MIAKGGILERVKTSGKMLSSKVRQRGTSSGCGKTPGVWITL